MRSGFRFPSICCQGGFGAARLEESPAHIKKRKRLLERCHQQKEDAGVDWRAWIGPTDASNAKISHPNSIRAMICGLDLEKNCVQGSDSPQYASGEGFIFIFLERCYQQKTQGGILVCCID
ncbi:hypothetical protein MKX03_014983 [Papaver bracteatum]|nr:hypothetical protein MKX03_014983 [Papaver bracteatum]